MERQGNASRNVDYTYLIYIYTFHTTVFCRYVELKEMAGRHDVLEWLPGWLRLLVQRLIAKPFIFQWMPSAKCHVCLMNSDSSINNITLEGTAMCELAMLT